MNWALERKRIPGQLFKITGQVCKAFCLHHEPWAWSTPHTGELVTTQKLISLSYGKATSTPWTNTELPPDHQSSLLPHTYVLISTSVLSSYLHLCLQSHLILTGFPNLTFIIFFHDPNYSTPSMSFSVI